MWKKIYISQHANLLHIILYRETNIWFCYIQTPTRCAHDHLQAHTHCVAQGWKMRGVGLKKSDIITSKSK